MPGVDYGLAVGDVDPVIDEVEAFVTGTRPTHDSDRVLATVLHGHRRFDGAGGRTRRSWLACLLDSHEEISRTEVQAHGGLIADFTGDGIVATFDGPARAVRAALLYGIAFTLSGSRSARVSTRVRSRGAAGASQGLGVHIAARVMALADGDEVLVSRTVNDRRWVGAQGSTTTERVS